MQDATVDRPLAKFGVRRREGSDSELLVGQRSAGYAGHRLPAVDRESVLRVEQVDLLKRHVEGHRLVGLDPFRCIDDRDEVPAVGRHVEELLVAEVLHHLGDALDRRAAVTFGPGGSSKCSGRMPATSGPLEAPTPSR